MCIGCVNASPYMRSGSDLWAGYDIHLNNPNSHVSSVSGSWIVTKINSCYPYQFSGTWLGIDGVGSDTIEQCGIHQYSNADGKPQYEAWFQWYGVDNGCTRLNTSTYPVKPGDTITASVDYIQKYRYIQMVLKSSEGWSCTQCRYPTVDMIRCSAEWIIENPYGSQSFTNTGTTTFKSCLATIDSKADNILGWALNNTTTQEIVTNDDGSTDTIDVPVCSVQQMTLMSPSLSYNLADTGNCIDGKIFNVVWKRAS